ncbi:hypothetical protein ACA910_021347 [Epithemia clementina (nom. ined.)]
MNDRAPIRDRTLVLRILVPRLEERLREKMRELEESITAQSTAAGAQANGGGGAPLPKSTAVSTIGQGGNSSSSGGGDLLWDLEGVSCEPTTARNKTLWNFHCDGATYPAKLVNLPCPVEIHKTVDHAHYYKCQDVAQMLIVYEDDYALEEAEEKPLDGFPSYYHSGLTPPMKRVVERRFAAREQKAVAPPRAAVADVEEELTQLMEQLQKDEKGPTGAGSNSQNKRNKLPSLASTTKVLEEVEEVLVDYEPWMDDGGKQPDGVELDIEDGAATNHPELFLTPEEIHELRQQHLEAQKEALREAEKKKAEALEKKEKKQQKRHKKQQQAAAAADATKASKATATAAAAAAAASLDATIAADSASSKPVIKKKGIASKKNIPTEDMDQITQAAMTAMTAEDLIGEVVMNEDFFEELGLDMDDTLID